jgi:tripartite-type tricarboxylate transporter receptor subunit TctC
LTERTQIPSYCEFLIYKKKVMHRIAVAALVVSALALPAPARAQNAAAGFPSRPIQLVVPYPPGGSNDIFARAIGKRLSDAFGKPVVVDNRPGASGSIGAGFVAKAPADGHTIAVVSSSFTTNAAIQANLSFDAVKSFSAVAMLGKGPLVLALSPAVPARTPQEFFALARANPGKLNYASSGVGSINHFATELLADAANIRMTHVPFKGMPPAINDLIGGHADVLIASIPSLLQQIKSGKAIGIGITSNAASPMAPGLPPLAGTGAPGYEVELWWGVLAPAGTPREIVVKLNAEINRALASEELKEFIRREGAEPAPMTPEAFGAVIASDIARWKKLAQTADIRAE